MSTATNTKVQIAKSDADQIHAIYARVNSQAPWKLIKQSEKELYVGLKWQIKVSRINADGYAYAEYPTMQRGGSSSSVKHDGKVAGFLYMNEETYTVKYGPKMSSPNKKEIAVKGRDLYAKLRDLIASKNNGLLVNDCPIYPSKIDATDIKKLVVDPIVDNQKRTDANVLEGGMWRVESQIDRDWTWFRVYRGNVELKDYDSVAKYAPSYGKDMKQLFGMGSLPYAETSKHVGFAIKTKVSTADLLAFFQLYAETPSADSTKEAAIVAQASKGNQSATTGEVVSSVKPIDPVYQDHSPITPKVKSAMTQTLERINAKVAQTAADIIDEKIASLKIALAIVDSATAQAIQEKIAALQVAKSVMA